MNDDERLRRSLHEALPTGPDFPSSQLLHRIMSSLPESGHRPRTVGVYLRRKPWVPALAALVVLLTFAELLNIQRAENTFAGRVEFLAEPNFGRVEFLSSQAQPADEYRAMTGRVLAGFHGTPDFNSQPTAAQDVARISYEQANGRSTVDLVALTQSDMVGLQAGGGLEDLGPLLKRLQQDRTFPQPLLEIGRFGTDTQYFIPWLQATYMMVVNKQALPYLPPGADPDHLTYDELIAWGQNLEAATGRKLIGLPADLNGPRGGLVHRFLQGYLYPSFTGTTLTGFKSREAVGMWQALQRLWTVTNPLSTTYTNMQDPLTTGEVWIGWDHQARLGSAIADSKHFVAIPAPAGPMGAGYMSAVVGLAIPKNAPNQKGAEALIDWLTRPAQQAVASASLSFTPVVHGVALSGVPAAELRIASTYQSDRDGVETVLPAGLGSMADSFTAIYQETFARIVLHGEDIPTVLSDEAPRLQQLVTQAKARCWQPDVPSEGPCQIR